MMPLAIKTILSGLLIPVMLRHGVSFWKTLVAGCLLPVRLYLAMMQLAPRFGLKL